MRAKPITFTRARRLRAEMSLPEVILWHELRGGRLDGLRFRRQHPVGNYVLDFYCASAHLAVEIDGASHDVESQVRHDERRDAWLGSQGIRVLRILAADILDDDSLDGALKTIAAQAPSVGFADISPVNGGEPTRKDAAGPPPRSGGGGPPKAVEGAGPRAKP
ncbi:MAG TPA: endonuclease domain-containing protein [Bauldia sp.]|nr:endonuclease domain-containing protein [Bauldia sp.]